MKKTLIIAEAGVNHNGDIEKAKMLIRAAKEAGADIVKFQTALLSSLVSKNAEMAQYQKDNIGKEESQKDMLARLLLPFKTFEVLSEYCKEIGIQFLSTPFDIESIHFLKNIVSFWKVPSGEITNYPYLVEIAKTGMPVIMSTGMAEISEIDEAIKVLKDNGCGDITLLHCNTQYPTPYEDVNLLAMNTLKDRYGVTVGYSDHTNGIEVSIAAVALGAQVIEKHFTLDKNLEGPDHKASLEPQELKEMITSIRNIEKAFGSKEKRVTTSEESNKSVARKSIVAKCDIAAGEVLTEKNITTKRPGNGISPMRWNEVLGTKAIRNFKEDELIEL
ncbi:MAG: N-acetylneuraminate synthase [Bacilli bacterium]|nr:N-acetylneuraminate synthase [Bacilli bacterium]